MTRISPEGARNLFLVGAFESSSMSRAPYNDHQHVLQAYCQHEGLAAVSVALRVCSNNG